MTAPVARVLRGGTETEVLAQDLAPGDVVLLGGRRQGAGRRKGSRRSI